MKRSIFKGGTLNIHVSDENSDTLLISISRLENVLHFHDLKGATVFSRNGRGFCGIVLDGFSRKLRSNLDMIKTKEVGQGYYVSGFGHGSIIAGSRVESRTFDHNFIIFNEKHRERITRNIQIKTSIVSGCINVGQIARSKYKH